MIWNDAEYTFRLSPVTRRAACPADSPRRMGWQTGDCAKAGAADTSSARIGSAWQAMRLSRHPHLSRSDTQSLNSSRVPELSSHPVGLSAGSCATRGGLSTASVTPWPHLRSPPLPSSPTSNASSDRSAVLPMWAAGAVLNAGRAPSHGNLDLNVMRASAMPRMFGTALRAWWDDDVMRLGASLAFYTLFAIAPVLLVATAIAGVVFDAEAVRETIVGQLDSLVGSVGAHAVQGLLEGASQRRAGIVATAVGIIGFVVAATGAFLELQAALNTIWRVKSNPRANLTAFLLDRLRSFGLVVAIGFLLMVSLAVTAALAAVSEWLSSHSTSIPLVWSGASVLVSLVVTTALFALLYRVLPDVHLRWRDVTTGAFMTAVLFTIGQQLIGLYLGQSSVTSSFGAAGSIMILLLWVYYSCQVLLLGAEFTRVYSQARHASAASSL